MAETRPRIGLFVTCLVDLMRPSVGFAAVKLLEQAGCEVAVPRAQTCCGQPAYNSGDRADTKAIAEQVIAAFDGFDYVVAPSGSCASMIKKHYPGLFTDDPPLRAKAEDLAERTFELVSFLTDVLNVEAVESSFSGAVTYHDSCSGLRELGVETQPRKLLNTLTGVEIREMEESNVCCGFGGTFCVKYPDISNKMVTNKAAFVAASGADTLLAGDLGCLMNMAGKLQRQGVAVQVRHVAEVLADMTHEPAIGQPAIGEAADEESIAS
ncbi:(Fe-S)-binding protein [Pelagibius litoralis]|uniref:(Fe-S)-binding protein n=1 Tax=Pelagibius litoralis TaxID=374515 RepID=A0A967KCK4_9PROT|nr:(Fe-S)-binding protein [Pelagibius litoralis]NIA71727.1 (Fe-S)-binding protein [Pelagibius litoralis]